MKQTNILDRPQPGGKIPAMLMAGWRSGDISALADLAQMRVDGVPFGEWSDEGAREAIKRLDMQP